MGGSVPFFGEIKLNQLSVFCISLLGKHLGKNLTKILSEYSGNQ